MKTIDPTKKDKSGDEPASPEEIQEIVHPFPDEMNITEGSEFLDDVIRMHDQPYGETTVKENE